jgi:hypothetical protein
MKWKEALRDLRVIAELFIAVAFLMLGLMGMAFGVALNQHDAEFIGLLLAVAMSFVIHAIYKHGGVTW